MFSCSDLSGSESGNKWFDHLQLFLTSQRGWRGEKKLPRINVTSCDWGLPWSELTFLIWLYVTNEWDKSVFLSHQNRGNFGFLMSWFGRFAFFVGWGLMIRLILAKFVPEYWSLRHILSIFCAFFTQQMTWLSFNRKYNFKDLSSKYRLCVWHPNITHKFARHPAVTVRNLFTFSKDIYKDLTSNIVSKCYDKQV